MTNKTNTKARKYAENKRQYELGLNTLRSDLPSHEAYNIIGNAFELGELLEPVLKSGAEADKIFFGNPFKFAGISRELLRFGAEQGNPKYALLGAKLYQKLGKRNRPFVLSAIRKSLENVCKHEERIDKPLDLLGQGYEIKTSHTDRIENGHRVENEDVEKARQYLSNLEVAK